MIVSFDGFKKKEEEIKEYKKSICKVIDDFILNDKDFRDVHASYQLEHYINSYDFYFLNDIFVVRHIYETPIGNRWPNLNRNSSDNIEFLPNEYEDLKKFMKDPDFYKNTKKYNL